MILHRAFGILRHQMETMTADNTYPSVDDCTKKTIWEDEVRSRACSLAHKLVYNCTNIITQIKDHSLTLYIVVEIV